MKLLNSKYGYVKWYLFEHTNCKITPTKQAYVLVTAVNLAPQKYIKKEVMLLDHIS
jgi:hypothetical protein